MYVSPRSVKLSVCLPWQLTQSDHKSQARSARVEKALSGGIDSFFTACMHALGDDYYVVLVFTTELGEKTCRKKALRLAGCARGDDEEKTSERGRSTTSIYLHAWACSPDGWIALRAT